MHITVILAVMLKIDVPHIALKKNYLEPKNYLEEPEWQDDSWSGNCFIAQSSTMIEQLQLFH